ncbi:MAG: NAD(P)H-dependent oxidoreductase, partial [Lentisphaeria bacterium]
MSLEIALLIGSLRKASYSRKVGNLLCELGVSAGVSLEEVDISELPLYNQDLEELDPPPAAWNHFRIRMKNFAGFLFVTPEYNRSVPAVLKNALDVGSRPWGESIWNGKPGAVVSLSLGAIGGFGANHHLRQTLACLNVPVMAQPEAYLGDVMS